MEINCSFIGLGSNIESRKENLNNACLYIKKHIGNIKYEPIDLKRKTATMGILIGDKDWRGKGVATEVIKASAHYLNSMYGVTTIFLGVNPNHQVAVSVYKKIGFKFKEQNKNNTKMIWQLLLNQKYSN